MSDTLLIISILPVIVVGYLIYQKDKTKEPINLIIKLLVGGVLSVFITLLLTEMLSFFLPLVNAKPEDLNLIELIIHAFIGVALVEEFSKWIMVYKIGYKNKEYDEFFDMIVYSCFVSLGFAGLENILYVTSSGIGTGILRAFLSVPGHAFFGVFMGYYLSVAKIAELNNEPQLSLKNKIKSVLMPMLLHGAFDYCLMAQEDIFILLYFIFIIMLYIFAIKKVKKTAAISKKFVYKNNYCPECGTKVTAEFCPNCGHKND